jgi:hypothetical protein
MTSGILGALIAIGITVPTAARLGRLQVDPQGELPMSFPGLRKRLIIAGSVSGGLGVLALVAGEVLRH